MSKLKVVWICHFSNKQVRDFLPLAAKGLQVSDYAPWITNLIEEFKHFSEIELHIISPHTGLKSFTSHFELDSIHYHFFKADLPFIHRHLGHLFGLESCTGFLRNRLSVRSFLAKINPDIINLMGAENAYYSSTVLGIKNIPILISIQGIYSNPDRFKLQKKIWALDYYERKIHKENKYFGISAPFMPDLIKRDASNPILFWNRFPLKILKLACGQEIKKEFDFVFFSRITRVKGPEDAIEALAIVKERYPNVTLRMMGPPESKTYIDGLRVKAITLGVESNLLLSGGFDLQTDMLLEAAKAKYYVLPTKIDTIPGTIFEAIYLGLPVVSYRTGDIPLLNKGDARVLLCDRGDIESLANNMIRLLSEPKLGPDLSNKAKAFVEKWFDNRKIAMNFTDQYKAVLAHYHNNQTIPADLLYENYLKDVLN